MFHFQEPCYNLRSETSQFRRENVKTTHLVIQSVKFLGFKIWTMVPQNIKNCKSLQEFKGLIKVWKPEVSPCRIWKKYVASIGFIWLNIHLSLDLLCFINITFFWSALIRHTYFLVWAIFKLTVNKIFNSIQFSSIQTL